MEKLDRKTLRERFKRGSMPSEQDFASLIDSMVNILEEGFDRSANDGLRITQISDSGRLFSFYRDISVDKPLWFIGLGTGNEALKIGTPDQPDALTLLSSSGDAGIGSRLSIGINNPNPTANLDVNGNIAAHGRRGQRGEMPVPADGEWHDITVALTGCEIFEIVAGVGGAEGDGRYSLLHAVALNAFNDKCSIKEQTTYFGTKCNRIELRWKAAPEQSKFHYKLQMRTRCNWGEGVWVRYYLTRLWFDPLMFDCITP